MSVNSKMACLDCFAIGSIDILDLHLTKRMHAAVSVSRSFVDLVGVILANISSQGCVTSVNKSISSIDVVDSCLLHR